MVLAAAFSEENLLRLEMVMMMVGMEISSWCVGGDVDDHVVACGGGGGVIVFVEIDRTRLVGNEHCCLIGALRWMWRPQQFFGF